MPESAVDMRDVRVRLGGRCALDGVTLALSPPAVVIVGPPGSGKTTLLKAACGLVPCEGEVRLFGETVGPDETARRRIQASVGFVFQGDALFDDRTALENVAFPLSRRGVAAAEAAVRARAALDAVGLRADEALLPERMSGGMRKRLGIARCIVSSPRALFADDPLAGLDPATTRRIVDLLARAASFLVVAASDATPLAAVCPRLVAVRSGRIALQGATADLLGSPELARLWTQSEAA